MINAAICTIGDEILIGQIVDTNSSYVATALNTIGVKVNSMVSIPDDNDRIVSDLSSLLAKNDIIIVTGGLGPTKDDITKKALATLFGSTGSYEHSGQLSIITRIFNARKMSITDINRAQASVPEGCEVIENLLGTAPCMVLRFNDKKYSHTPTLYSLPGVPYEAIGMLDRIIEDIKVHHNIDDIHHKTLVTFGIPESTLSDILEPWELALPKDIKLAYLPNPEVGVKLRLSTYGGKKQSEILRINAEFDKIRSLLGDSIYGEGEDTLPIVIGRLLQARSFTMSSAESCTGGRIASMITSIPGASAYYMGTVVSYDNSVKINVLGVEKEIIEKYGAVSQQCVEAMARGVKKLLNTDVSVATSGIAGPGGGTKEKPVGTAWLAVAFRNPATGNEEVVSKVVHFGTDRERNITRFASNALDFLRRQLLP